MAFSQVDQSLLIDSQNWAISLLLTTTFTLGHTLIAVEGMDQGVRIHRVAHYVPYVPMGPRPSLPELLSGYTTALQGIKGQVKIKDSPRVTATIRDLVGAQFSGKAWRITPQVGRTVLRRIHDDVLRGQDLRNPTERYDFRMVGTLKLPIPETSADLLGGINCANWSQAMLRLAGIDDTGGAIIDLPRTQLLFGTRSQWLLGFMIAAGVSTQILNNYYSGAEVG
jgi:hypothetical protein